MCKNICIKTLIPDITNGGKKETGFHKEDRDYAKTILLLSENSNLYQLSI